MKFIIILKQNVQSLPPVLSLIEYLLESGEEVVLVSEGDVFTHWKVNIKFKHYSFDGINKWGILGKICTWIKYRLYVRKILDQVYVSSDILWVGSADAALSLGFQTLKKYSYVAHIHELYDIIPLYRKKLSVIMQNSVLNVVPEINRAYVFKIWYNLINVPTVVFNKPYLIEGLKYEVESDIKCEFKEIQEKVYEIRKEYNRTVLYQGMIHPRRNIQPFLELFDSGCYKKELALILMGPVYDGGTMELLKTYKNVFYIGKTVAPNHLKITELCDIGILTYSYVNLNNYYCAPNKIWEYSKFGLPIVSNYLAGVNDMILNNKIGDIYQDFNIESIRLSLDNILSNLEEYRINSRNFYNNYKINEVYCQIIDNLRKRE